VDLAGTNTWAKTGAADFSGIQIQRDRSSAWGHFSHSDLRRSGPWLQQTGALNGDGTGNFLFGIECSTCGNGGNAASPSSNLVFSVANATIAELTAPNNLVISSWPISGAAQRAIPGRRRDGRYPGTRDLCNAARRPWPDGLRSAAQETESCVIFFGSALQRPASAGFLFLRALKRGPSNAHIHAIIKKSAI
jgi:hypothetical protein